MMMLASWDRTDIYIYSIPFLLRGFRGTNIPGRLYNPRKRTHQIIENKPQKNDRKYDLHWFLRDVKQKTKKKKKERKKKQGLCTGQGVCGHILEKYWSICFGDIPVSVVYFLVNPRGHEEKTLTVYFILIFRANTRVVLIVYYWTREWNGHFSCCHGAGRYTAIGSRGEITLRYVT